MEDFARSGRFQDALLAFGEAVGRAVVDLTAPALAGDVAIVAFLRKDFQNFRSIMNIPMI